MASPQIFIRPPSITVPTPDVALPKQLSDTHWQAIKGVFARDLHRKRKHDIRTLIDAILYAHVEKCGWRGLPERFGPWQTVNYYFNSWTMRGKMHRVFDILASMNMQKN